ncbi:MAG TPA: hypothetical protein VFK13_14620 [Gemmatimonadaceae bacterium]|nr:hypothetical protein [Gemmatimonadaceae bacterium]
MTSAPHAETASEATMRIESIAAGGDGVARHEGLVVFVPRSAPGDLARVRYELHGRLARGEIVELLEPGPGRIDPPCPHYRDDRCGGCQLQHLDEEHQRAAKRRIVSDALERIGRRRVDLPPVRASARAWRYRRKLTLALRRDAGSRWIAGLHPYDDPARVFDVHDCPITDEAVLRVWDDVRRHAELLPRALSLRGSVRVAEVMDAGDVGAVASAANAIDASHGATPTNAPAASLVLEGGERWPESERFFAALPKLSALWWAPEGKRRRLLHARGDAPPGASFAQVNPEVAAAVRRHVIEILAAHAPATVVDAYAGLGDLASELAAGGATVTSIEADADAARWSASRLTPPSRSIAGRVENHLAHVLPADAVVLNPPRAGVDAAVTRALQHAPRAPRVVVYVSCNPATLARDLARMPRYRIASVSAFDMFPQTAHVETVCALVPEEGAS